MKRPHWPDHKGFRDISLGLERVETLLERVGNPHLSLPPVVHIAGTNGKGSTLAFMRSVMEEAGYKVHSYTSPHLVNFNERIVLAGEEISDDFLFEILEECRVAAGDEIGETYFEGVTVAALLAFSKVEADIVLLETGMGGRLDATNVIDMPLLTVITSISRDHTDFLGDDLIKIAYEKAGIIKPSVPCILAHSQKPEVEEEIRRVAASKASEVMSAELGGASGKVLGLQGKHQYINADTAMCALHYLKGHGFGAIENQYIDNGFKHVTWLSRLQSLPSGKWTSLLSKQVPMIVDGGHNEAAASMLARYMEETNCEWHIVYGSLDSKDPAGFLHEIAPQAHACYCVTLPEGESMYDSASLYKFASQKMTNVFDCSKIEQALEMINGHIMQKSDVEPAVLICGSLHLAGYVLEHN